MPYECIDIVYVTLPPTNTLELLIFQPIPHPKTTISHTWSSLVHFTPIASSNPVVQDF